MPVELESLEPGKIAGPGYDGLLFGFGADAWPGRLLEFTLCNGSGAVLLVGDCLPAVVHDGRILSNPNSGCDLPLVVQVVPSSTLSSARRIVVLPHPESKKKISDRVVSGKPFDTQQSMQGLITSDPTGLREPARSSGSRNQKGKVGLSGWDRVG